MTLYAAYGVDLRLGVGLAGLRTSGHGRLSGLRRELLDSTHAAAA